MKRILASMSAVAGLTLTAYVHAQTPNCPPLPNQVTARAHPRIAFDSVNNIYTYSYDVANERASLQEIDDFSIDVVSPVSNFQGPQGWTRGGLMSRRSTVMWGAIAVAEPRRLRPDASIPPSIAQIKPGETVTGFVFQSPKPPGPVTYYVTGFAPVPPQIGQDEADAEMLAERLIEQCPQLQVHEIELAVTGITFGPSNSLPVKIDVKPGRSPNRVNPRSKGVLSIAIFGASTFDVQQIDRSTVAAGSGQAAPMDTGRLKDVNRDGVLDLVLKFSTSKTGLQCGDTSLFLTGKTLDGTGFSGVDSVVTVGCKDDDDDDDDDHDDDED